MDPIRWELRQATAPDEEPLYQIHRAAMQDHVGALWGWDEADQQARFRAAFEPARISVITVAGQTVGLLQVDDRGDEIFLASFELAPETQRRGLGGEIVRSVLKDAAARNIPVRPQVLRQNPARRLYERLGFHLVGETATHVEMLHD